MYNSHSYNVVINFRGPPSQGSPRDMTDGRSPPSRHEDALPAVLEFPEDSK